MIHRGLLILLSIVATTVVPGCSHFFEGRAITAFTQAMSTGTLADLNEVTSTDFREKALRRAEALDDLRVLRLPEEPPSIVSVNDVSENEKHVTVQQGEGSAKLLYKLVRESDSRKWVVDDIFTRQRKQGVRVSKAVTDQMDLLLTIRDFLESWEEGDRESVLAITTPKFRSTLAELPPSWLARLTGQVVDHTGRHKSSRNHRPQVAIDGETAVVRLPRTDGTLQLSMRISDGSWKVDDAAVEARRDESAVRSVHNRARVILAGTAFANAFREGNKTELARFSTPTFFSTALKNADLAAANLPDASAAPPDYELKATVDHAALLIPGERQIMKIEFDRRREQAADGAVDYLVKEVSLYEGANSGQLRLSAFFTAKQRVLAFHQAVRRGDLLALRSLSSASLNERVWTPAKGLPMQLLSLAPVTAAVTQTGNAESRGKVTRITVGHGQQPATYVLQEAAGALVVDDILTGPQQTDSLKRRLELSIPVLAFAAGIESQQIADLQRLCSRDFNRLVWDQTRTVPQIGIPVIASLTLPVNRVDASTERAALQLGQPNAGADVELIQEQGRWVIHEIRLRSGLSPSKQVRLKQAMRMQVAYGTPGSATNADTMVAMRPTKKTTERGIVQAGAVTADAGAAESQVQHAVMFEPKAGLNENGPNESDLPTAEELFGKKATPREPGIINPAPDAVPHESVITEPAPQPAPKSSPSLDELFGDSATPSTPEQPVAEPAPAPQEREITGKPGRVTDPSRQPVHIPKQLGN